MLCIGWAGAACMQHKYRLAFLILYAFFQVTQESIILLGLSQLGSPIQKVFHFLQKNEGLNNTSPYLVCHSFISGVPREGKAQFRAFLSEGEPQPWECEHENKVRPANGDGKVRVCVSCGWGKGREGGEGESGEGSEGETGGKRERIWGWYVIVGACICLPRLKTSEYQHQVNIMKQQVCMHVLALWKIVKGLSLLDERPGGQSTLEGDGVWEISARGDNETRIKAASRIEHSTAWEGNTT